MSLIVKKTGTRGNYRKTVHEKRSAMFKLGLRILFMGASPDRVLGERSYLRFMLLPVIFLYTAHGFLQVFLAVLFEFDSLDAMGHLYMGLYYIAAGFQWTYLLMNLKGIHEYRTQIESFHSTQAIPELAEAIAERNLKTFTRSVLCVIPFWCLTVALFGLGNIIQFAVIIISGELETTATISSSSISQTGQMVLDMVNMVMIITSLVVISSVYTISGFQTLEVVTQCEIICAAMARDTDKKAKLRLYIMDHIQVIKNAKWLIKRLESLNTATTFVTYFLFALNMFILTLVEPGFVIYATMATDFVSAFLQLAAQGWFSTSLTIALQSVSHGSYETIWYLRDKSYALDVLIISQMAQQECVQKVFFGTLRIERATAIDIVRRSYSFYTLLMVMQSKK